MYVPQGGYWSSAMTTRTISTNSITLEKDYDKFLLIYEKYQNHNYAQDIITALELIKRNDATYDISILAQIGNFKNYQSFYIWILDGAKKGEIVGMQVKSTFNNPSSNKKYDTIGLYGLN